VATVAAKLADVSMQLVPVTTQLSSIAIYLTPI
jgi:hypothetical protein